MIEKDLFLRLMLIAKSLDDSVRTIESAFDVQLESGPAKALDDLMNLLVECTLFNPEDLTIDPAVLAYAFTDSWGEISRTYSIDGEEFVVDSLESLYVYLRTRFLYDKNNTEVRK